MTGENFHIVTIPRSGSKVLQALLTLGVKFKYGDVCTLAPKHQGHSLGEFLMFQHLRRRADTKSEGSFHPVSLYDIKRVRPGRYQLVEAGHAYFQGVPENAFSERVLELSASTVPWVVKSFPAEMTRNMRLDSAYVAEQLELLRPLSRTIALIRRNIAHAGISRYLMRRLNASTPGRMQEKVRNRPVDAVPYQISESYLNNYATVVTDYLGWIGKLGYDKLLFMEDVIAKPVDVIVDLFDLSGYSDVIGLRHGLRRITDSGREASAHFAYRDVVGNYDEVVAAMRPVQDLIDQLRQ